MMEGYDALFRKTSRRKLRSQPVASDGTPNGPPFVGHAVKTTVEGGLNGFVPVETVFAGSSKNGFVAAGDLGKPVADGGGAARRPRAEQCLRFDCGQVLEHASPYSRFAAEMWQVIHRQPHGCVIRTADRSA